MKEVFSQLRDLVEAYQEIGLDPPPVSGEFLAYPDTLDTLETLRAHVGDCKRCKLHKGRKNPVFGEGAADARLVFIGEGPGKDEDREGRPFVGRSGRLLTDIIVKGIGLKREEVYICNMIKCRPPGNRDPKNDEIEACIPFLEQQLRIIKPEVLCTLGRVASQTLLGKPFKISQERGKWHSYNDIPLMPTFHPSYILRNPSKERLLKGQVWEDIKKIMKRLNLEVKKNV
ncbi:MAG: uracil-DNA glycosylase [Desulfobacterales bacterium]|nr:uracil-DNA glycosylase [Desulfobacterales bacterium]